MKNKIAASKFKKPSNLLSLIRSKISKQKGEHSADPIIRCIFARKASELEYLLTHKYSYSEVRVGL